MVLSKIRIDWKAIVKVAEMEARNYFEQNLEPLTLRGLFYILVSKGALPNTKSAYKTLSSVLAEYRYNGLFPSHLIKDVTRRTTKLEVNEYFAQELSEEEIKEKIKQLIESYSNFSINPWKDQPYRVIAAIEKEALYDIVEKFISEFQYGIYELKCLKGFDSATDIISLAKTVNKLEKEGYTPVILVLSDFDPSGEEIFNDFQRRLKDLSKSTKLIVEKIMITKEQVLKYNLPYAPESQEEIEKLRRDSRYKRFVEQHGLMRVELDALFSIKPEEAKRIILESIHKYYDQNIFQTKTLPRIQEARSKSEEAKRNMLEKVKKIIGET